MECLKGTTRIVFLVSKYAFKFPRIHFVKPEKAWKLFLRGLLANMQESEFGKCSFSELAPVVFSIPGGFCTVMVRAKPLTNKDWGILQENLDNIFCNVSTDLVELKRDSFGTIQARIVAVDYG